MSAIKALTLIAFATPAAMLKFQNELGCRQRIDTPLPQADVLSLPRAGSRSAGVRAVLLSTLALCAAIANPSLPRNPAEPRAAEGQRPHRGAALVVLLHPSVTAACQASKQPSFLLLAVLLQQSGARKRCTLEA